MSWVPVTRNRTAGKLGIWVALSEKDVRITFYKDVWDALSLTSEGAAITVDVGADDHMGRIRVSASRTGLKVRQQTEHCYAVSFRKWASLMDGSCAGINTPFKVVGAAVLEVTLPYWGTAMKQKAKVG